MAEHEHPDLDPALRDALRDLDYEDSGPPASLRASTLDAVRAQPARGDAPARAARRRSRRPAVFGGALAVAAASLAALLFVVLGSDGTAPRTEQLAGSAGTLTAEIRDAEVTLKGDGAPLPAGAAYELWTIQGDPGDPQLTSAGTFRPDADGTVDAELTLPPGTPEGVPLAVTREDDDDPAPNLPPVLSTS